MLEILVFYVWVLHLRFGCTVFGTRQLGFEDG